MANRVDLNKIVKEFAGSTMKKELDKYSTAGKMAAREIRESIVNAWFDEYNSSSVNAATVYNSYTMAYDDLTFQIIINSYVDLGLYKKKPKAASWREKYGGKWDPEYYVLVHLQMTEGIIGLPKESKAYPEHGWENRNRDTGEWYFVQREQGLRDAIFHGAEWDNWSALVEKYAK